MRLAFPKLDPLYGSPTSPPSPLTLTASSQQLISKPLGEVTHVGHGGYTLKNVLEQYGWKDGLYDKTRVFATRSYAFVMLRPFFRNGFTQWPTDIWIRPLLILLKLRIMLNLSVKWCDISLTTWICNSSHTRHPRSSPSSSNLKETGLYMTIYMST